MIFACGVGEWVIGCGQGWGEVPRPRTKNQKQMTTITERRVSPEQAVDLPEGSRVTFNRWAAQCYSTVYYRVATYQVTPRKRGKGNYLKLVSSGRGAYPHIGGKYQPELEGRIIAAL